jgi:hypothetical protein
VHVSVKEGDNISPAVIAVVLQCGVLAGHMLPVAAAVASNHGDLECLAGIKQCFGHEEGAQSACVGGLGEHDGGGC